MQFGPSLLRTKKAAEAALSALIDHGWITEISERPRKVRLVRERK
jgi:hypothetical protein